MITVSVVVWIARLDGFATQPWRSPALLAHPGRCTLELHGNPVSSAWAASQLHSHVLLLPQAS